MGQYDPLSQFLKASTETSVPLSFAQIEVILGFALPAAGSRADWWANDPGRGAMTEAWLSAGFAADDLDVENKQVVFRRVAEAPMQEEPGAHDPQGRHPLFGARKGTFTIAPGVDLTEPACPEWAEMIEHPDYGKID